MSLEMRQRQRGAALIVALLIVTLAASTAAFAIWQQSLWVRQLENVTDRAKADQLAAGGIDLARNVLKDDKADTSRPPNVDSLNEPWASAIVLPAEDVTLSGQIVDAQSPDAGDDEENMAIPAGYTYLGQFIDHDITFDPGSSLTKLNDPDALHNFRTPALDLDSVYGSGPKDEPFRYTGDRFILGTPLTGSPDTRAHDLPRASNHRAIIGDHRNDENVIVAQLHSVMMRFHNAIVGDLLNTPDRFASAQQSVQWHYQWVVVWDFLCRICGRAVVEDILPTESYVAAVHGAGRMADNANVRRPRLLFYRPQERAFMPVDSPARRTDSGTQWCGPSTVSTPTPVRSPLSVTTQNIACTAFSRSPTTPAELGPSTGASFFLPTSPITAPSSPPVRTQ